MSDDLPEIVVPDDAVAVRGRALARLSRSVEQAQGLPPGRLWIVGTDHDGSVIVWEIPEPDEANVDVDHRVEPVHWYGEPVRLISNLTTTTWRIVTSRPWSMRIWPKGAWKPQ